MTEALPSVTVIIAARPDQPDIAAVKAARNLDYGSNQLEILVARGKQPSVQRNTAIKAARGEIIYFLDDDSMPLPDNLRRAAKHFSDASVKMVGGPNLCPPDAPALEQIFGVVLSAWLAFGPSRARYSSVGSVRTSGEKELILCNLLARRDSLIELGGFDEKLYPNEENALMDELQRRNGILLYDPDLIVHRRPRQTLGAFARMLRTYGRGRAEQFRLHPTLSSTLNFVPPLFCLYLLLVFVLNIMRIEPLASWSLVPLALYAAAVMLQTLALMGRHGFLRSVLAMPLIVLSHVCYGIGFWRGFFSPLRSSARREPISVDLETVVR